ncbi:hypothetical protein LT493_34110 [Streptomyces tricolor]|nr:hypothetical protein [Streptomyces tricolor]
MLRMGGVLTSGAASAPPPAHGTGLLGSPVHVVQTRDHCAGADAVQRVHLALPVVDFR